jgi:hypothetical protein
VADTDVDADSTVLVDAPVSLTLLSQTDPLHPSNDKDGNPNGSPGDEMPCAICAALHDHGTTMDAVLVLKPQTPDDTVARYFRTMMGTINHCFSGIQQQMATTIADSIRNVLDQKITPLHDYITVLGNCLDVTTTEPSITRLPTPLPLSVLISACSAIALMLLMTGPAIMQQ